ncbi:hypothetical protein JCM12856_29430 [Spirochaeta dissipatitropha]
MHTRRVGFFRRSAAFLLDLTFVLFLFAVAFRLALLLHPDLDSVHNFSAYAVDVSAGIDEEWEQVFTDWESFFVNELSADELQYFEQIMQEKQVLDSIPPGPPQEMIVSAADQLFSTAREELPASVLPDFDDLRNRTMRLLEEMSLLGLLQSGMAIVAVMLRIPLLLVLLYWSTELFFGWSPGKFFMRIAVASLDGSPGNIALFFSRFVFKQAGLLLFAAALYFQLWWLLISAILLQGLVMIGFLRVLGRERRAFHDRLSGTAVYYRRSL